MDKSTLRFEPIASVYERNNRSKYVKSLRCFPTCNSSGHSTVSFCGSSLKAVLVVYIDSNSPQCLRHDMFWNQVLYIAEIRCSDEDGLSSRRYILKSEILPHIRTKDFKCMPYIQGVCTNIKTEYSSDDSSVMTKDIALEFNSELIAWHYGWTSHRYARKTHVIDVMILVEPKHDVGRYFLAGSFLSPCFSLVSTRKSRVDRQGEMIEEGTEGGAGAAATSLACAHAFDMMPDDVSQCDSVDSHTDTSCASMMERFRCSGYVGTKTQCNSSSESCSIMDSDEDAGFGLGDWLCSATNGIHTGHVSEDRFSNDFIIPE